MRRATYWVVAFFFAWAVPAIVCALPPDVVHRGEKATALLETPGDRPARALGTAFCVSSGGTFVTSARIASAVGVGGAGEGLAVRLVLCPGAADARTVDAKVVRLDAESDLAVLQVYGRAAGGFTSLELADTGELYDTMDVSAFGYPNRNGFGRAPNVTPISVNTGHITTLQKDNDQVRQIGIDAQLDGGQVGGPVLDAQGRVVGVVESVVFGNRGPCAVVPANRLAALLAKPVVTMKTGSLSYEKRHERQELSVAVTALRSPAPPYEVELTVRAADESARTMTLKLDPAGVATFAFVPVQSKADDALGLTARFARGTVGGAVANRTFKVADYQTDLAAVRRIEHKAGADAIVTLADGGQRTGTLAGLSDVPVELGDATATVDLAKALEVNLTAADGPVRSLTYTVTVHLKDQVVSQFTGAIDLAGAPPSKGEPSLSDVGPHIDVAEGKVTPAGSAVRTPLLGGTGGGPIELASPDGKDVVGFSYQMSTWDNRPIVEKITPLYDRATEPGANTVVARDGYVVGGLLVDSDLYVHAVRVIFVRVDDGRLNPKDNYVSSWLGTPVSGEPPKQLAGRGERVVGLCGRRGLNMDAIGLILKP